MSSTNDSSKNKNNQATDKPTGFLSHLIELRDRLLKAVIAVGIIFVILFPFASNIYDWLASPLGRDMIIIGPVAPFLIPMKLTLMVAFLIALPYLLYHLWSFVAPGLYKHEKRLVYPLLASSVLLFYLGILFVYFVLLPMMFQVIPQFVPQTADFKPDIAQYLDFVVMMFMAFGIGFEMPIATILLISTGMTTAENLKKKRPYVIVGAFIIGMLLTPPDVISQIMLAIPMWILFEIGLIFSKYFNTRIKEAGEAREELDKEADKNSDLTEAELKTAAATAGGTSTAALTADQLWEDDSYIFEEDDENDSSDANDLSDAEGSQDNLSEEERSILNKDPLDEELYDDDYLPEDEEKDVKTEDNDNDSFFDNDDFHEMSDEEMEAELDRIEADEMADDLVEEKAKERAKKKQEQEEKENNNKK